MKEYYGDSAKKYGQPQDKYFTLFPAIDKAMPKAYQGQSAIDLGCGTGVLVELITSKGYQYVGVDVSEDMLMQAKNNNPGVTFVQADVTLPLTSISQSFDLVVSNMVVPSMENQAQFDGLFQTAASIMHKDSVLLVAAGHPCFDGYMQKHFFNRSDIQTDFVHYFDSGAVYEVNRMLETERFVFTDHHWTISDYYKSAAQAGMHIVSIDECPLVGDAPESVKTKYFKKGAPSYIVFTVQINATH